MFHRGASSASTLPAAAKTIWSRVEAVSGSECVFLCVCVEEVRDCVCRILEADAKGCELSDVALLKNTGYSCAR